MHSWKYLQGEKTRQEVNSEPHKEETELRDLRVTQPKFPCWGVGGGALNLEPTDSAQIRGTGIRG